MSSTFSIGPCCYYVDESAPVRLRVWYSALDRSWHVSARRETWDSAADFEFRQTDRGRWNLCCPDNPRVQFSKLCA